MARTLYPIFLIALLHLCYGYKILVFFPLIGKSHDILGQGYVRHLLEAGHEVTYVTPFPTNKTNSKYHEVDLSANIKKIEEHLPSLKGILDKTYDMDVFNMLPELIDMARKNVDNDNLKKFLSDTTQEFDAVIVEWLFIDMVAGHLVISLLEIDQLVRNGRRHAWKNPLPVIYHMRIAPVFDAPLIWSSSIEAHGSILKLIHEHLNPAFNTDILSSTVPPFTFYERCVNLLRFIGLQLSQFFYLQPHEKAIYEEFFTPFFEMRGKKLPAYEEVVYNGTFMLTNSHTSIGQPISVPPNVKEIGGYHIGETKPLPADLQKIMDEAKDGVIYFSMGSNAKSKDWPEVLKKEFLELFGSLKQTVLWKFEKQLPNLPKNVHILHWAPQQSILAHPNVRLFITHGGLLSNSETVYFGVPTIVMPYGADQHINARRAVNKGYALMVELSYEMTRDMKVAIEEILTNPKYTEKVKQLSKLYHNRLVPPGKELVHWVEHVIETRGAPHLRSPALLLPWYQKAYLDVLLLVLVTSYVTKLVLATLFTIVKSLLVNLGLLKTPVSKKKQN